MKIYDILLKNGTIIDPSNKINSKGSSIREAERNAAEIALKKINEKKNIKN